MTDEEFQDFLNHLSSKLDVLDMNYQTIIAMRGPKCTGRKLLAVLLAAAHRCPLIKEDDAPDGIKEEIFTQFICPIAKSQLYFGLDVVIDSDLSEETQFNELKSFAEANDVCLAIVQSTQSDVSELWQSLEEAAQEDVDFTTRWWDPPSSFEDLEQMINAHEDNYDIGETPILMVEFLPTDDLQECAAAMLKFVYDPYSYGQRTCEEFSHVIRPSGVMYDEVRCNLCQQRILGWYYKCSSCDVLFHKTCTNLPEKVHFLGVPSFVGSLSIRNTAEDEDSEFKCSCCKRDVEGYFYVCGEQPPHSVVLDLDCMFLYPKPIVNLHTHELCISIVEGDYTCDACGVVSDQRLCYQCENCEPYFTIDPHCAFLPEVTPYERHKHPFELTISPTDEFDEYYCDICQEKRDPKHWIYYCAPCEYPTHIRCLLPPTWPPCESTRYEDGKDLIATFKNIQV